MRAEDRPDGAQLFNIWWGHLNGSCPHRHGLTPYPTPPPFLEGVWCQAERKMRLQYVYMQKDKQSHRERAVDQL